jgi:VanZ family protein
MSRELADKNVRATPWPEFDLRCRLQTWFHPRVSRLFAFVKYWLPVVVWMGLIFIGSGDELSNRHTSRFLGPLLHWLLPIFSDATVNALEYGIRKCGHVTEFGVLALLLWRALRRPVRNDPRPWSWLVARQALLLAACYAGTDEFHQLFVPSREARVHDVVIDTCGAAVALLLLWLVGRWRKHW